MNLKRGDKNCREIEGEGLMVIEYDRDQVRRKVLSAINNFKREEIDLLAPLGSEPNIAQRFARWLETEFPGWHVDYEYNRIVDATSNTARVKTTRLLMERVENGFIHLDEPHERKVVPDIIIHRRKTTNNLLAIEIKTKNNRVEIEFDYEKLRAYRKYQPLRYLFALFIRFQEPDVNGEIIAEFDFV
jgi:hypothetical protein